MSEEASVYVPSARTASVRTRRSSSPIARSNASRATAPSASESDRGRVSPRTAQ